jgi:CelD/BcsL family acetyltransferase involved in cellulose biosynthesis
VPLGATIALDFAATVAADLAATLDMLSAATTTFLRKRERVSVAVEEGAGAVARTAADWRTLEGARATASPFQSLAFAEAAEIAHLRRGEIPRIVVVRENERPMAIMPTVVSRWAGMPVVRFLGDPLHQYGDVLAAPGADAIHVARAWQAVADPGVARAVYLRKVRADSPLASVLDRRAVVISEDAAPFVATTQSSRRTARDVRELRRFGRRLAECGDVRIEIVAGGRTRTPLAEALTLKRDWLAARGLSSKVIGNRNWEAALMSLAGCQAARAATLTVGGRTAAIEIGFAHGETWQAFLGAVASDFAKFGPGHVLTDEIIAHCRAQGLTTYDLLAPADPYKRAIAHGVVPVRDYAVALDGRGQLAVMAARLVPAVKARLTAIPTGLRRALLSWRA